MPENYLGEFEQLVLLAVLRLADEAYGLQVGDEIERVAERRPSSGALYTTLDRLEQKGHLQSRTADASAARGGRPRRYYALTDAGLAALRTSGRALMRMWAGHVGMVDRR